MDSENSLMSSFSPPESPSSSACESIDSRESAKNVSNTKSLNSSTLRKRPRSSGDAKEKKSDGL